MNGGATTAKRLSPGRHGLSPAQVRESQQRRLVEATAAAIAERGYGGVTLTAIAKGAGVSTASFYQHFDGLPACLLASFESGATRLCGAIEAACETAPGEAGERAGAGIAAGLGLLAAEPALARLLSTQPPAPAGPLWAARRRLISRLIVLLRKTRTSDPDAELDGQLIGGAFALVARRLGSPGTAGLEGLEPVLTELLLG